MDRIDEIIQMFDDAQCPKNYKECPLYEHNDCDNYCPFVEASDMLKDYKRLLKSEEKNAWPSGEE